MGAIEIDQPSSWPARLAALVSAANETTPPTNQLSDLRIPFARSTAIEAALSGYNIAARHFARLLPHEAADVLNRGLRPHSTGLFDDKIDAARAHGYFDTGTSEALKAITLPRAEPARGDRRFVCLTVGRTIELDPEAVAPLLESWGGEGIYFAEGAEPYRDLLRSLGRPATVHVSLPFNLDRQNYWPGLPILMLGRHRGMRSLSGDVLSRCAIPAKDVVEIEWLRS